MKRIMIWGCIALIIVLAAAGCSMRQESAEILSEQDYIEIGEAHNELLAGAYDRISSVKASQDLPESREEMKIFVSQTVNELAEARGYMRVESRNTLMGNIVDKALMNPAVLLKAADDDMLIDMLADSVSIISRNKSIFDSLYVILNSNNSQTDKEVKISALYEQVNASPDSEEEKAPVLAALETARRSSEYWSENLNEWEALLNDETLDKSAVIGFGGAVAIIDAAGAVVGVIEGLRDTEPGEDRRGWKVVGRGLTEAGKASLYAIIAVAFPILL